MKSKPEIVREIAGCDVSLNDKACRDLWNKGWAEADRLGVTEEVHRAFASAHHIKKLAHIKRSMIPGRFGDFGPSPERFKEIDDELDAHRRAKQSNWLTFNYG